MTMTRSGSLKASFVLGLLLLVQGCSAFDSRLFNMHASNDARGDAKRRWNDLRGNARLQLAQRHLEAGRVDDAERELEAAMATAPAGPAPYILATRIRLERGQLAEAREALAAARTRSDDPEIDYLEGIIEQRYGNTDAALIAYTHASDKSPLVPDYILARAEMLVNLGRQRVALDLLRARMQDFDRNVPMRCLAARIARTLDAKEPAVEYAREAVRLSDNDPATVAYWGNTLVWAGQFEAAVDALQPLARSLTRRSSEIEDEKLDAEGQRAIADFHGDSETDAQGKPADSTRDGSVEVIHDLARACVSANRHDVAVSILAPWAKRHPRDLLTTVCVARAALAVNDAELAAECLRHSHKAEARSPESMLLLAYAEFKLERYADAADAAQVAVKMDAKLASGFCMLGRAEQAQGRIEEARAAYEHALVIDPGSRAAAALLRRLSTSDSALPDVEIEAGVNAAANQAGSIERSEVALRGGEACR